MAEEIKYLLSMDFKSRNIYITHKFRSILHKCENPQVIDNNQQFINMIHERFHEKAHTSIHESSFSESTVSMNKYNFRQKFSVHQIENN